MDAIAVTVGSSTAPSSMATALTLSSQWMGDDRVGSIGTARKMGLGSSMVGRMVAIPQRRKGDAMRLPLRMGSKVSRAEVEVKAQSEPMKDAPPLFPLLDLYDFICRGPLLKKIGFTEEKVAERIDDWLLLGVKLSRQLQFDEFNLSPSEKGRIYHYYVPVFLWCKNELEIHASKFKEGEAVPPLVIGISAPQGCGKTTIVYSLEFLFNSLGSRAAAISIDDFYLTAAGQKELAASNSGNRLLEMRGNAGSHDLQLGTETLKSLRSLTTSGTKIKLPRYNKSANAGYGDRADPSQWSEVEGPVKVVLFEGWMLGFDPQEESAVTAVDPQLAAVNEKLKPYHDAWHSMIDSWVIIQVGDPNWVYEWRLQAEIAMRNDGRPGLTDEQVADFVSRYMPAYKAYLPALYSQGPQGARQEHMLKLDINEDRNPLG